MTPFRFLRRWPVATCLLAAGCATSRPSSPPAATARAPLAQTPPAVAGVPAHLPPTNRHAQPRDGVMLASHQSPTPGPEPVAPGLQAAEIGVVAPAFPIDLPTALRLADAENLQVILAREQIQQAYAELDQFDVLWLPSLRGGVHWNKHEGPLLDTVGNIVNVSRGSMYAGAGAAAVGAGSPAIPGLFANFNLSDAIFQPLAAQQRVGARQRGAAAIRNNVLLDVSLGYLELLRAAQDVAITRDLHEKTREISRLTDAYARTGQGLQADADRMRVELGLRENDIRRSEEAQAVASARLAQLLRLPVCVRLDPVDPVTVPLCLISPACGCNDLVARAIAVRPEIAQNRFLEGEAIERLRREQYAPLVPNVFMGTSYGGFGGGLGGNLSNFNDRFDFDVAAYWELRNLGWGEAAARDGARSRVRQAQVQRLAVIDQVAREVAEAHAQVVLRQQQIDTARRVVQAASESYDHNLVRIQHAQGLPIEVLQSMQALLQARREYLRSVIDFNIAQFTLQRAMGWPLGQAGPPSATEESAAPPIEPPSAPAVPAAAP
jgi:outer membrane protein TolC